MSVIHPHRLFPSDNVPVWFNVWWRDNADLWLSAVQKKSNQKPAWNSTTSNNLIIYPKEYLGMENEMNGRKPTRPSRGTDNSNGKPSTFQWINIPLTAEDINFLSGETVNLEQLSYALVSLGVLGLGISVKFDSARKSYSVSIYGSDISNNSKPCGISGSATDLRDALLVSLYRFNHCLQGSFDGSTTQDNSIQSSRFK